MSAQIILNGIWSSRLQLIAALFVGALLSIGQGQELSQSLQGSIQFESALALLSVAVFALQLWVWTYISVLTAPVRSHLFAVWSSEAGATADSRLPRSAKFVAGLYCGTILLFVMYEFLRIGNATAALWIAFINVLLVAYIVRIADSGGSIEPLGKKLQPRLLEIIQTICFSRPRFARLNPSIIFLISASLGSSFGAYFLWTMLPDDYAFALGSFGSVFVASAILAPWPFLIFVLAQGFRIPIVLLLILSPFFAETIYTTFGLQTNLYALRQLSNSTSTKRPTFDDALARWKNQDGISTSSSPIVFVTAAGGGIRAAYWTAAVLGRLEDCIQNFHKSIFSISSVSGGSLGASAFVTLVADQATPRLASNSCDPPIQSSSDFRLEGFYQSFLRDFLSRDYLAPVIREMLLGDIPRSITPWRPGWTVVTDRGIALEQAWERAWTHSCDMQERACSGQFSLTSSFSSLSKSAAWLPLLLLNGVHEETGKRLITSTVRVVTDQFVDSTDFFDLVNHDVRISTAILNSARFPIISPSGSLFRVPVAMESLNDKQQLMGHVIDGGYFDNNGTATSHEVASAALAKLGISQNGKACADSKKRRQAIFIEILNDTTMTELDSDRDNLSNDVSLSDRIQELASLNMNAPFRQLLTVARGLESSRAARAVHASKSLGRFARETCDGSYFVIPLCKGLLPQPALGWMLSLESRKAMDQLLLGGIDYRKYDQSKSSQDFYACYAHIQLTLATIVQMLAE
jgi:hypothetical protein